MFYDIATKEQVRFPRVETYTSLDDEVGGREGRWPE